MRDRSRTVVIVALLVLLVVSPLVAFEAFAPASANCREGPVVAVLKHSLTPYLVLNSPYLGEAQGNFTVWNNSSGEPDRWGVGLSSTNGSIVGDFEDLRWTVDSIQGRSGVTSCDPAFTASSVDRNAGAINTLAPNLTSDSDEPTSTGVWNTTTGYSLLYYSDSFVRLSQVVSTCASHAKVLDTHSSGP
jgi:hypothetical protein